MEGEWGEEGRRGGHEAILLLTWFTTLVSPAPLLARLPSDKEELLKWSSYGSEVTSTTPSSSSSSSGPVHSELFVNFVIYVVCGRVLGGERGGEVLKVLRLLSEMLTDKGVQEGIRSRITIQVNG